MHRSSSPTNGTRDSSGAGLEAEGCSRSPSAPVLPPDPFDAPDTGPGAACGACIRLDEQQALAEYDTIGERQPPTHARVAREEEIR